jgi:hypothetical protein
MKRIRYQAASIFESALNVRFSAVFLEYQSGVATLAQELPRLKAQVNSEPRRT